jgi:hypothetical protein
VPLCRNILRASIAKVQLKKIAPEEARGRAKDEVIEQAWYFQSWHFESCRRHPSCLLIGADRKLPADGQTVAFDRQRTLRGIIIYSRCVMPATAEQAKIAKGG